MGSHNSLWDYTAVSGLAACTLLALLVPNLPSLQPGAVWRSSPGGVRLSEHEQTANSTSEVAWPTLGQSHKRDNATLEAALEAACMGAFLADAAALGLHGVYDLEQLHGLLRKDDAKIAPPEFRQPLNVEYEAAAGSFSAYAYEALPIMHTLMGQSQLEERQFRADSHAFFSGYRGHINAAMRQFTANVGDGLQGPEAAVDTDAAHALIKVPLLVARYADHEELAERVRVAISVQQRSDTALLAGLAFASVLERMAVWGDTVKGAARWAAGDGSGLPEEARGWLQQVLRRGRGLGAVEGVCAFGQGGRALEVLQSGLHVALKADDYAGGVRQNILAGGDSTARAHVVGALLGAQHGEAALPQKWRRRVGKFMDVKQMVHVIIVQRTKFVPFHINRDPQQQPGAPAHASE